MRRRWGWGHGEGAKYGEVRRDGMGLERKEGGGEVWVGDSG